MSYFCECIVIVEIIFGIFVVVGGGAFVVVGSGCIVVVVAVESFESSFERKVGISCSCFGEWERIEEVGLGVGIGLVVACFAFRDRILVGLLGFDWGWNFEIYFQFSQCYITHLGLGRFCSSKFNLIRFQQDF